MTVPGYTGKSGDILTISVHSVYGKPNHQRHIYREKTTATPPTRLVRAYQRRPKGVADDRQQPDDACCHQYAEDVRSRHRQIRVHKVDADTGTDTIQGDAALTGTKFEIWDSDGNIVDTPLLGECYDGYLKGLAFGDYIVKEVEAGDGGYLLNGQEYPVSIDLKRPDYGCLSYHHRQYRYQRTNCVDQVCPR